MRRCSGQQTTKGTNFRVKCTRSLAGQAQDYESWGVMLTRWFESSQVHQVLDGMDIEDMDAELATYDLTSADCKTLKWEQDDYECNARLPSHHFTDETEAPPKEE